MNLELQGSPTKTKATVDDVLQAVQALSRPGGPTYVLLNADSGDYAQAAGTDGRYVVESRIALGEGFVHLRVCRPWPNEDCGATVFYDSQCSKHPRRQCPIRVRASEVCGLTHVETALVGFVTTGTQTPDLQWRNVSAAFKKDATDDDAISTITPRT